MLLLELLTAGKEPNHLHIRYQGSRNQPIHNVKLEIITGFRFVSSKYLFLSGNMMYETEIILQK